LKSEEPDDNKIVPDETQKKIVEIVNETLFPAVLAYIAPKYPRFLELQSELWMLVDSFFFYLGGGGLGLWEEFFTRKQRM
jgi:hypothetical protein